MRSKGSGNRSSWPATSDNGDGVPIWSLEVHTGRSPGSIRTVESDRLVVGRGADCDIQLKDQRVSRRHVVITRRDGTLWAEDLGSRAGTRLGGRRLSDITRLSAGDTLELSDETRLVVRLNDSPTASHRTQFRDAASMLVARADIEAAT